MRRPASLPTSNRLGLAFAAGYTAALERLVPDAALPCALCVTQDAGNHPRAIKTLSDGPHYTLDGTRSFVTFGSLATTLIVAARVGERPDGRPEIVVVRIPADGQGVLLEEASPIPIVPELTHTRVSFDGVVVYASERMQGDGYASYVKPFRTVEDIHAFGAATAYLVGLASRSGASADWKAELYALLATRARLGSAPALELSTHVALHGAARTLDRLLECDAASGAWNEAPAD
jgi:alkylation response protein AidB-like acyl-CoA dehydrogenase